MNQQELIDAIESLVDSSSLVDVLLTLGRVCNEKAEHLRRIDPNAHSERARVYNGAVRDLKGVPLDNAQFIVRACNSHDALVEALRDAQELLDVLAEVLVDPDSSDKMRAQSAEHCADTAMRFRAAIAKATA